MTRVEDDQWVVDQARDQGYGVKPGDSFLFSDTYCARMVTGEGPSFAPDSRSVPCYATAAIGKERPVASYVGTPLLRADGSLFGTLCAIDPSPQPTDAGDDLPFVELVARTLSSLLEQDSKDRRN